MKHKGVVTLVVWFIIFTQCSLGFSDTTRALLAKYPNRYSLTTQMCQADGIETALRAGFNLIRLTDLSQHWYFRNRNRLYRFLPNVRFWHGDPTKMLDTVIANIHEPITFWLNSKPEGRSVVNQGMRPILQELEFIKQHPIKTHTILIDNMSESLALIALGNVYLHQVIEKIREINPNYRFFFEDGILKNDVLAAYIP